MSDSFKVSLFFCYWGQNHEFLWRDPTRTAFDLAKVAPNKEPALLAEPFEKKIHDPAGAASSENWALSLRCRLRVGV